MKRTFTLFAAILIGIVACSAQNLPTIHNDDIEQSRRYIRGNTYQRDLLLYVDALSTTHPYYADTKHRAELNGRVRKMYNECGNINDITTFRVYLERIASSLNDGHTSVPYWSTFSRLFPVRLALDGSNPAVIDISPESQSDILGKEVSSINDKPIAEILRMARPLISADNEVNFENMAKEFMMFADFWTLLGMSNDTLRLTLADGSTIDIAAIDKSQLKIAQLQKETANRVTAQRGVLFDYNIFEDEGICYLQFNQFADRLIYPQYPQLARFDSFLEEMFGEIAEKGIHTLVVDLQYNGGGNSTLGDVLLSWLKPHKETKRVTVDVRMSKLLAEHYPHYLQFTVDGQHLEMGKVYNPISFDNNAWNSDIDYTAPQDSTKHVYNFDPERIFKDNVIFIEGKSSFSSSTLLLTTARDNGIGTIIGEISGGRPSHYGDILYFKLPNTETIATVSHKHFVRPNRDAMNLEYVYPDVEIELNDPEHDLAWEWIVKNYGSR